MSLSISNRNTIKESIQFHVEQLINQKVKPSSQAKNRWKYKNASDWHYGQFVGMMQGLIISTFSTTVEQMKEVEELIEEHSKELRDFFKSFDSD